MLIACMTPGTILFSENHIHLTEEYIATKSYNGITALDSYINSGTCLEQLTSWNKDGQIP